MSPSLAELLSMEPRELKELLRLALFLEACGQPERASVILEGLVALDPAWAEALGALARVWRRLGRPDEAVDYASLALEASPEDEALAALLAEALMDQGRLAEARLALEGRVSQGPDAQRARMRLRALEASPP